MTDAFDPRNEYDRLTKISDAAFAAGSFDVTYHVLMAALHCAADADDPERMRRVAVTCRECLRAIDSRHHQHRLSSEGSASRGTVNVFQSGAGTAEAMAQHAELDARLHAGQDKNPT